MPDRKGDRRFLKQIDDYYARHARVDLPWRQPKSDGSFDPYEILVSEMMLQQTQVQRVIPKYELFLKTFPTIQSLASASLRDVLAVWSGLGYNRRAQYLHKCAQQLLAHHEGSVPTKIDTLTTLSGIGHNTAAAIVVYAYNQPVVFVETNIRSVYLHHYFRGFSDVDDRQILPLLERTLDTSNPRLFYWKLMDYGSYLKRSVPNPSRQSKHHSVQSPFRGSTRQIRGEIIRCLLDRQMNVNQLAKVIADDRFADVLTDLVNEGIVVKHNNKVSIKH